MDIKLKPCPCCGHKALVRHEGESYGVCCVNCFLEIASRFERPEEAARQWNRRSNT